MINIMTLFIRSLGFRKCAIMAFCIGGSVSVVLSRYKSSLNKIMLPQYQLKTNN